MKVYRLEYKHVKEMGPFGEYPAWALVAAGVPNVSPEARPPAEVAQVVALTLDQKLPYRFRKIVDDIPVERVGDLRHFAREADKRHHLLVHGFTSMEQYHEWFSSPEQRKALFTNIGFGSGADKGNGYNDLELRCFNVPDDKVFVADHQVVFALEDVISSKAISRKEAIS